MNTARRNIYGLEELGFADVLSTAADHYFKVRRQSIEWPHKARLAITMDFVLERLLQTCKGV
jgi:hypothetical protein